MQRIDTSNSTTGNNTGTMIKIADTGSNIIPTSNKITITKIRNTIGFIVNCKIASATIRHPLPSQHPTEHRRRPHDPTTPNPSSQQSAKITLPNDFTFKFP